MTYEQVGVNREPQSQNEPNPEERYQTLMTRIEELESRTLSTDERRELGLAHIEAGVLRRKLKLPEPFERPEAA